MDARELIDCIKNMSEAERFEIMKAFMPLSYLCGPVSGLEANQQIRSNMTQEQKKDLDRLTLL